MTLIGTDIETAANMLVNDQIIAIPTETVYGLAGNALNISAVKKIYEIKERPFTNPLIIHLPDTTSLGKYVNNIPDIAIKLAKHFWPGPLTLLLPKNNTIPDIVTAGLPNVAVRIPSHPLTLKLLKQLPFPLAAPSANPFGYISPTTAEDVQRILFGKIDYVLDGGLCETGIESTIVGFDNEMPIIYRVGAISPEAIKKITGKVEMYSKPVTTLISPGMLPSHYAPNTSLYLTNNVEELLKIFPTSGTGVLAFTSAHASIPENNQEILSANGNLDEAAHNLYRALHRLDSLKLERIIAERVPNIGIGIAINDRLEKAALK